MRYTNRHFTYLLTYLLTSTSTRWRVQVQVQVLNLQVQVRVQVPAICTRVVLEYKYKYQVLHLCEVVRFWEISLIFRRHSLGITIIMSVSTTAHCSLREVPAQLITAAKLQ